MCSFHCGVTPEFWIISEFWKTYLKIEWCGLALVGKRLPNMCKVLQHHQTKPNQIKQGLPQLLEVQSAVNMDGNAQLEVELGGMAFPSMLEVLGYNPIIMTPPTSLKRPQELTDNENTSHTCLCDAAKTILELSAQ